MSGTLLATERRHPANKKLSEALADAREETKGLDGISKVQTLIKAPDDESDAQGGVGATMRPTDEQLARINQFSRKTVTADEVVAFKTLSCNDIPDRDDDQFSTQCVKDIAALEPPFSPTGKSFLIDHHYSMNYAKGRIFGTDTEKIGGALYLTNEVYIPNTEKNASYIEDLDFGVAWAVSVGIMLGRDECSICKSPFVGYSGWWCAEGHDKGLFYDPKSDETDSWGYPLPVDPSTSGAVKCIRIFHDPRDMYELSNVILGAQYNAALDKGVMQLLAKSAEMGIPTIGLSKSEAEKIPFQHEPKRVSIARAKGLVKTMEDGTLTWIEDGMVFAFDPDDTDSGICSIGKAPDNSKEASDGERGGEVPGREGSEGAGDDAAGLGLEGDGAERSVEDHPAAELELASGEPSTTLNKGDDDTDPSEGDDADPSEGDGEDDPEEDEPEVDPDEDDDPADPSEEDKEEEKAVTKKAVMSAAKGLKLPDHDIEEIKAAAGNGLDLLVSSVEKVISDLTAEKAALETKASLGEKYVEELRKEALDWYVKARQTKPNDTIKVESYERLLGLAGDDAELLKAMAKEQKELAQERFPKSVRRSSFPSDPNVSEKAKSDDVAHTADPEMDSEDRRIRRRHI